MELFKPLSPVIPVFLLIAMGFTFARWKQINLASVASLKWGHALGGALVRIVGGFSAANVAVTLIGAEGVNRQVLLLYGCLPSAVVNFVLTEKYRQDPELAASIVVLSTFLSTVTIPIVFWLIM
jgi:predicted permease